MTYPNAYDGIKKVFTAQILVLIGIGCTILGGLVGGVSLIAGSLATAAGGGVFLIAGVVLSILSLIFSLIGLSVASRDEAAFRQAFIWTLVNLIVTIIFQIISIFTSSYVVSCLSGIFTNALGILIINYVFKGVANLAEKLGNTELIRYGNGVKTLLFIVYGVTIFVNLLNLCFPGSVGAASFGGILSFLTSIASLVGYILYMVFLSRSKNMLAAH